VPLPQTAGTASPMISEVAASVNRLGTRRQSYEHAETNLLRGRHCPPPIPSPRRGRRRSSRQTSGLRVRSTKRAHKSWKAWRQLSGTGTAFWWRRKLRGAARIERLLERIVTERFHSAPRTAATNTSVRLVARRTGGRSPQAGKGRVNRRGVRQHRGRFCPAASLE
jgi:hypothetical protein